MLIKINSITSITRKVDANSVKRIKYHIVKAKAAYEKRTLFDKGTCETFSYPHLFFEIPSGKPTMDFVRHKADSMTDWLA